MKIYIDGRIAKDYTVNEIVFNYDSVSDTFSLTRPFFEHWEVNRRDNNETYRMFTPLKYYEVRILDDQNNLLLTGTLLNHTFSTKAEENGLSISGYSKTGILSDCSNVQEMLKNSLEVEQGEESILSTVTDLIGAGDEDTKTGESSDFSDISLLEFAKKLCAPFGIEVIYDEIVKDKVNEKYEATQIKDTETIASCLSKLATLKNLVLRCNVKGQLLFTQIDTNKRPVMNFETGKSLIFSAKLNVNGQGMHSAIYLTGAVPLEEEDEAESAKSGDSVLIKNPLISKYRPIVKKQSSEKGTLIDPVKAALANELKGISVDISCKGWDFVDNNLIRTGDLITILCPDIYIYQSTKLVVTGISLKEDVNGKEQTLTCVLPESFTGEMPKIRF
jgi:prophage tail gpP-like protein